MHLKRNHTCTRSAGPPAAWGLAVLATHLGMEVGINGQHGFPNERILPGCASRYITEAVHPGWVLVVTLGDGLVYFGLGPVSVARSPAPF